MSPLRKSIIVLLLILPILLPGAAQAVVKLQPEINKSLVDEQAHTLFPAANYPYVQRPNHCGANDWTHIVPEHPFCFKKGEGQCLDDFTQACDQHDLCYMTLGADRRACDQAFYQHMLDQCQAWGSHSRQHRCRIMAYVYYEAVRLKAQSYFDRIQKKQDLYETWLQTWQDQELKRQRRLVQSQPNEFVSPTKTSSGETAGTSPF